MIRSKLFAFGIIAKKFCFFLKVNLAEFDDGFDVDYGRKEESKMTEVLFWAIRKKWSFYIYQVNRDREGKSQGVGIPSCFNQVRFEILIRRPSEGAKQEVRFRHLEFSCLR